MFSVFDIEEESEGLTCEDGQYQDTRGVRDMSDKVHSFLLIKVNARKSNSGRQPHSSTQSSDAIPRAPPPCVYACHFRTEQQS